MQRSRIETGNRRALVIGATGSAGHHIVRELQERGFTVSGTCRDPKRAKELTASGVHLYQLDLLQHESIQKFAKVVHYHDVMIDNAGALTVRHPDEYRANDTGKRLLYEELMVKRQLPKVVTHVSSSMVVLAEEYVRAGFDPRLIDTLGDYTLSKYCGEMFIKELFEQTHRTQDGLIILRPAMLMGPGDYGSEAMLTALAMGIYPTFVPSSDSLREGARWLLSLIGQSDALTPAQAPRMSLMAVEDFAREAVMLTVANLDHPRSGTYTLANRNEPMLPKDIIAAGQAVGKPRIYNPWLPRVIFALLLWLEEQGNYIRGKASSSRAERWRELTLPNLNVDRRKLEEDFPALMGDHRLSLAQILAGVAAAREKDKP